MDLILRFNDGVAIILHIPVWLPLALVSATVAVRAFLSEFGHREV